MFGALALYGTTTSRSLAGWGQFLFMGLIGVVLASFVGHLLAERRVPVRAGFIGVIVFTGLTAYDAQRLKQMALATPAGQIGSYAIVGALTLYLDFINLFLMLLRFLGHPRDELIACRGLLGLRRPHRLVRLRRFRRRTSHATRLTRAGAKGA